MDSAQVMTSAKRRGSKFESPGRVEVERQYEEVFRRLKRRSHSEQGAS